MRYARLQDSFPLHASHPARDLRYEYLRCKQLYQWCSQCDSFPNVLWVVAIHCMGKTADIQNHINLLDLPIWVLPGASHVAAGHWFIALVLVDCHERWSHSVVVP